MNSKKKTIVMTRFPYESSWGGEESHTLSLAEYFRKKGYEVIFFGSCDQLLKRFQEKEFQTRKVWGGKMFVTKFELLKSFFLSPFIIWNLRRSFRRICDEYEVKALYSLSLNEKIFLTPTALTLGIPVTWVEHQEIKGWLLKNPWKKLYKKYAQYVRIVPISKKNESVLGDDLLIPKKNIRFIVNGVNIERIKKMKRKTKKGMILVANRMIPKKGVIDVLKAIEETEIDKKGTTIVLLGEGEERKHISTFAKKNMFEAKVEIKDFLKKEKWYEALLSADVFVSSARDSNETFSLNTAEAMAAGCKVVVTGCSGIADFIEDNKEAFLCLPNNPLDMREKIRNALEASEGMRRKAQERAEETFDIRKMLTQYESIIFR